MLRHHIPPPPPPPPPLHLLLLRFHIFHLLPFPNPHPPPGAFATTLAQVKLGILAATISPYVVARIGATHARRFLLTAETMSAAKAMEVGLLHEVGILM